MEHNLIEDDSLGVFSIFPPEILIDVVAKSTLLDALRLCKVSHAFRNLAVHSATHLKSKLMSLVFWYIDTKRPKKAIDVLQSAKCLFPSHPDIFKELGCCWMDLGKSRKALSCFRQGLQVATNTPYGYILKAQAEWALGNNEEAWKLSNEAVSADPLDPRTYHFRAFMQSSISAGVEDRKSQETEVNDYLHILERIPQYQRVSIIHNNLGYVYYEMKEFQLAKKHFDMSIQLCPHHVQTYYNKALCLAEMNDMDTALLQCEEMLKINNSHADAFALQGWINVGRGEIAVGIENYKHALQFQDPKDSYTLIVYTGGLVGLNRFDDAEAYLNNVLPSFLERYETTRKKLDALKARSDASSSSAPIGNSQITTDERISYSTQNLMATEGGLAACYRILAEIHLALGRFDRVLPLQKLFQLHVENVSEASKKRMITPFLKLCSPLDLNKIRPSVVKLVMEYHKMRENSDPETSFRRFQRYLSQHHKSVGEMCEDEQKYFIACVGHFCYSISRPHVTDDNLGPVISYILVSEQLLSLFWEGDQYVDTLDRFFDHWTQARPGFLKLSKKPHFLVNLFDLSTRMDNADMFGYLFAAVENEDIEGRLLIRALERLGDNPLLGPLDVDDVDDDDDDGFEGNAQWDGVDEEAEEMYMDDGLGAYGSEEGEMADEQLDQVLAEMEERFARGDRFSDDEEQEGDKLDPLG